MGEKVWVEWDGRDYPAYITEAKGNGRFRVHMDGYDSRWDQDVSVARIKGRVSGKVATVPPPPAEVARALGLRPKSAASGEPVAQYEAGDRVRVRWRGAVYGATVVAVRSSDRFLVHYDGLESAWDEVVRRDRIVGRR